MVHGDTLSFIAMVDSPSIGIDDNINCLSDLNLSIMNLSVVPRMASFLVC